MVTSEDLLQAYLQADCDHHDMLGRYFGAWSGPPGTFEVVNEAVITQINALGDATEEARKVWLRSLGMAV